MREIELRWTILRWTISIVIPRLQVVIFFATHTSPFLLSIYLLRLVVLK